MTRFIQLTANTPDKDVIIINAGRINTLRQEKTDEYGDITRVEYGNSWIYVKETPGEITALCTCKRKELSSMYGKINLERQYKARKAAQESRETIL